MDPRLMVAALHLLPLVWGAPSNVSEAPGLKEATEAAAVGTERPRERAPEAPPQPPQTTFPFPLLPSLLRPDTSQPPALPFPFPFLFPSFVPRPSARALDPSPPPSDSDAFYIITDEFRRNPTADKKKPKKKKKQQKKPKYPKPVAILQKDDQVPSESSVGFQPGFAGQLMNGNQGSYLGYYMVYLVEVTWNGSNQTQTVIAGRPILATKPVPTESAQITDLSGSFNTESPYKPPPTATQCLFQRSTTTDLAGLVKPLESTDEPAHEPSQVDTGGNNEEIISEETAEDYDDESDPKKAHSSPTAPAPVTT